MATEVKERSVPKPVFTDAEAGAKEFPSSQAAASTTSRRASAARPCTRTSRSTSSPTPRATSARWVYAFANGDRRLPEEWTALKCSNWHEFLDPNEEWEQTIYRNNANVVRQISQNIEHGRTAHVFQA